MNLHIKPVQAKNRDDILQLQLLPNQRGYIETVEQCLSEADQDKRWHPVGIYQDSTLIGFAMYGFFCMECPYYPKERVDLAWDYMRHMCNMCGFYDLFPEKTLPRGRLWLDRFLIDCRYQGNGYGKAALELMIKYLSRKYHEKDIYLSVVKENAVAIRLYQSHGFKFTGEKDIHGEDVMVRSEA